MAARRSFASPHLPAPRAALLGLASLAGAFASLAGAFACRGQCRTLQHCDAQQCSVLSALQVGQEQPRPVGCVEKAKDNAPGVSTYARDAAGTCWIFPTTLIAEGYAADDSCGP